MDKDKINWEERRFYASSQILSGMFANYHHGLTPSGFWVKYAVTMADELIKVLASSDKGTICPELYESKVSE